jgi:hypothetical protein
MAALVLQRLGLPPGYAVMLPIVAAATQWSHARRYALLLTAAFLTAQVHVQRTLGVVAAERGFFGVVKVLRFENGAVYGMMHGNILHGLQRVAPGPAPCAISYYAPAQEGLAAHGADAATRRVGVVGLGIGTLIACGETGEQWRFYEINPVVVQLARDPRYFRYLSETEVAHDIVVGEGRLAVAREPAQSFDVLIIDAFASDAIPVHLLTREAFATYVDKLAPHGLLLMNISNQYLDLVTVVSAIGADLGLSGRLRRHEPSDEERAKAMLASIWVALARDADGLGALASDARWQPLPAPRMRPWTDGYSSLLSVMRWTRPASDAKAARGPRS